MPTLVKVLALLLLVGLMQLVITEIAGQNGGILNTVKRSVTK